MEQREPRAILAPLAGQVGAVSRESLELMEGTVPRGTEGILERLVGMAIEVYLAAVGPLETEERPGSQAPQVWMVNQALKGSMGDQETEAEMEIEGEMVDQGDRGPEESQGLELCLVHEESREHPSRVLLETLETLDLLSLTAEHLVTEEMMDYRGWMELWELREQRVTLAEMGSLDGLETEGGMLHQERMEREVYLVLLVSWGSLEKTWTREPMESPACQGGQGTRDELDPLDLTGRGVLPFPVLTESLEREDSLAVTASRDPEGHLERTAKHRSLVPRDWLEILAWME